MFTLVLASLLSTAFATYSSSYGGNSGYGGDNLIYLGGHGGSGILSGGYGPGPVISYVPSNTIQVSSQGYGYGPIYSSVGGGHSSGHGLAYAPGYGTGSVGGSVSYRSDYDAGYGKGSVGTGYASSYGYVPGSSQGMRVIYAPQLSQYMGGFSNSGLIGRSIGMPGGGSFRIKEARKGQGATIMVAEYTRGGGGYGGGGKGTKY